MTRAPGSYAGLTVAQGKLLSFLRFEQSAGRSPSFDEMAEAMNFASKSGIHRLVQALAERGYLYRLTNRARSIKVLDEPQHMTQPDLRDLAQVPLTALLNEIKRRCPHARTVTL